MIYLEDFFVIPDLSLGIDQMINSYVHLARDLRSAMKFRFEHPALKQIAEEGSFALENVWSDTPIALPFPKTYVEIDIGGQDGPHGLNKFMMYLEERHADTVPDRFTEKYKLLGIEPGEYKVRAFVPGFDDLVVVFTATVTAEFTIEQGEISLKVEPLEGVDDIIIFYDYAGNLSAPASANTGLEQSNKSILFLYEDDVGVLSLVMIHMA